MLLQMKITGGDQANVDSVMFKVVPEDGFTAEIITYDRTTSDLAEIAQVQLNEVGVELEIEILEIGAYLEVTANGGTDLYVGSWGTVTLDVDYGLYPMLHSENAGAPGNRSFFANDEERLELYKKAQQIIINEAPIIPVYHFVLLAGLSDRVDGFYQYPSSFPYLRDVTLD